MELFGVKLFGKDDKKKGLTFSVPSKDDGAVEIETGSYGSSYAANFGLAFDLDKIPNNEYELLSLYRTISLSQEVDEALQEIVNEAIITDELKATVDIILQDVDLSDNIKKRISEEFKEVLNLLDFKNKAYNLFHRWYVDGKIVFHKVIDPNKQGNGVVDIIPIDPLNIKLVREYKTTQAQAKGERNVSETVDVYDLKDVEEYFIYSKVPFNSKDSLSQQKAIKIPKESIIYCTSGLMDESTKMVLSYLYKAIKPYNNLKLMEDSVVIYRVTRAPERRIFYIDVGNLPKGKAEQYLKDVMNRFRNKIVYNASTGTINNQKKFQSMIEDYWLPRREGGKGTEVSTLPGGEQLGEMTDVNYFKEKLYKALNVPLSRFQGDSQAFNIGRTTEITRDEIKFHKYISRLRKRFSHIFDDLLKTQLVMKKILSVEEWEEIQPDISYSFLEDNYFSELKEVELMNDRVNMLMVLAQSGAIGKYYSHAYVRKSVLKQSEDEMKEMDKEIEGELSNERFYPREGEETAVGAPGAFNNF